MAANTDTSLQKQLIYSVYVRNHTEEGTFSALVGDLDRIKALGTDIVWLLPIHPIGEEGKKGSLGCPYANRDYRDVNPCYGTMEDFKNLVAEIHKRGMKCMIDVVYNHTSPDSVLRYEHPEYFYHRADGSFGNKIGDWADVIDLDYSNPGLWDYQIESLCMWAKLVDGFRCDVASFVPVEFWQRARAEVAKVNPGCIWLAESVHMSFGNLARSYGFVSDRDIDLYSAFDMEYDYDIRETFDRYIYGKCSLSRYLDMLNFQEAIYPANYNKMRCLENHDQPRIRSLVKSEAALENFTAFLYFLKGATLIYAGQEFENEHLPSLFEHEPIDRNTGKDIAPLLVKLREIKDLFGERDWFRAEADDEKHIAVCARGAGDTQFVGVFSLRGECGEVTFGERDGHPGITVPDGEYENLLGGAVTVKNGVMHCAGKPVIFKTKRPQL